jgi:class 3 adenylate cyclase
MSYRMNEYIYFAGYTLCYYQLESMLLFHDSNPANFSPLIQTAEIFIVFMFSSFLCYTAFLSNVTNPSLYSLVVIYLKYIMDVSIHHSTLSLYQYEIHRLLMWLFTTPLILKIYSEINKLTLLEIGAHYHIGANVIYISCLYVRNYIPPPIFFALIVGETYFMWSLLSFQERVYTKFILFIWLLFSLLNIIEYAQLFNYEQLHLCYLIGDTIAKWSVALIVYDHEERIYYLKSYVDLQGITFLTTLSKSIQQFEKTTHLTTKCSHVIQMFHNKIKSMVPMDKTPLKLELLKKILPLELEENYLSKRNDYKQFPQVCVLFTDIVSYTDLAKKYESSVIFQLLHDIYTRFDDIVKKYGHLQKIETIGDAYMVVGDLYHSYQSDTPEQIISLAQEFIEEIKKVPTPDGNPLQLRIGIHIGEVVVGILGVEIPRLCVVGNTVNMAARLQTTADPDTIQISKSLFDVVSNTHLIFDTKDNVFLKNIGSTTTYIWREG